MPVFVNEREISDEKVHVEMQHHPAASAEEAMEKAAAALAIRELLVQEARRMEGLAGPTNASDDEMIAALLERAIEVPEADEAACRAFYEQRKDDLPRTLSFAEALDPIRAYLRDAAWGHAFREYVWGLIGRVWITGVSLRAPP